MSGLPWYRHFPADFIHGTMALTLEERGAYITCLDLMYERGGPIADDDHWLSRVCNCTMQRWKKLKVSLIAAGKLNLRDGKLSNGRATYEMHYSAKRSAKATENGKRGGRPSKQKSDQETCEVFKQEVNENNDITYPKTNPTKQNGNPQETCVVFEPETNDNNDVGFSEVKSERSGGAQKTCEVSSQVFARELNENNNLKKLDSEVQKEKLESLRTSVPKGSYTSVPNPSGLGTRTREGNSVDDVPKPKRKRQPYAPLPDDWRPNKSHADLAQKLGFASAHDLEYLAARMRNWAAAHGVTRADWHAQFRNLLLSEAERRGLTPLHRKQNGHDQHEDKDIWLRQHV